MLVWRIAYVISISVNSTSKQWSYLWPLFKYNLLNSSLYLILELIKCLVAHYCRAVCVRMLNSAHATMTHAVANRTCDKDVWFLSLSPYTLYRTGGDRSPPTAFIFLWFTFIEEKAPVYEEYNTTKKLLTSSRFL